MFLPVPEAVSSPPGQLKAEHLPALCSVFAALWGGRDRRVLSPAQGLGTALGAPLQPPARGWVSLG